MRVSELLWPWPPSLPPGDQWSQLRYSSQRNTGETRKVLGLCCVWLQKSVCFKRFCLKNQLHCELSVGKLQNVTNLEGPPQSPTAAQVSSSVAAARSSFVQAFRGPSETGRDREARWFRESPKAKTTGST